MVRFTGFEILHLRLRLRSPFTTGYCSLREKDAVILRARTEDGHTGYGEAPVFGRPDYLPESVDTVIPVLSRHILPPLVERELGSVQELISTYAWVAGNGAAKTAVEQAFLDVRSQMTGVPLHRLWDGRRRHIEAGTSIGSATDLERTLHEIDAAIPYGYRRFKIKITPETAQSMLQAVRDRFAHVPLSADANGAYRVTDVDELVRLDRFGLLCIEQPLPPGDLLGHARVAGALSTPICLDESVERAEDAATIAHLRAASMVSIKPARAGGPSAALSLAAECRSQGLETWCGGMLETGIGRALCVHLSACEAFSLPAEISSTAQTFEQDVLKAPIEVADGRIDVPQSSGRGYEVDEDVLGRLVVGSTVVGRPG